jgi:hypothetical protein
MDKVTELLCNRAEGFVFACPGIAISSTDVTRKYDRELKKWVLTYESDGGQWIGMGDTVLTAYLDLIHSRLGRE